MVHSPPMTLQNAPVVAGLTSKLNLYNPEKLQQSKANKVSAEPSSRQGGGYSTQDKV